MEHHDIIRSYIGDLGFSDEIARIYITLCTHGTQSVSELARNANLERTRLYRMLDELKQSKLAIVEVHYKREMFRAAPLTNLQLLVSQKEQEAANLRADLPNICSLLSSYEQERLPTRVQFYKGNEGMKQMLWNETKAKGEVSCILYNNMQQKFGLNYLTSWIHTCNQRGIRFRGIIGDQFINDQKQWYKTHQNEQLSSWTERYISSQTFPITYSTVVFDHTVSFYNWKDSREVFGIEIHNQEIADAQRKFFDLLWQTTAPSKHVLKK